MIQNLAILLPAIGGFIIGIGTFAFNLYLKRKKALAEEKMDAVKIQHEEIANVELATKIWKDIAESTYNQNLEMQKKIDTLTSVIEKQSEIIEAQTKRISLLEKEIEKLKK